ncbi:hypothetical protein JIN84_05915 [Luteolibacter yonseiensis]|uniref:Uncharacterized protein n=1 Tax=Luteolibacter yonseiensis TaxID=1144680 RepID=A0A934V9H2_9BACT|nr:hypothetical protein [Luteolibacter yonseiensis]MBK1815138.1 hypothetical protein [Luteolibacter yonseiensis]
MELPGKSLIKAYDTGGEIDKRNAAAVWNAVGEAGDKLQGLGETGMKVSKEKKEAATKAKAAEEAAGPEDRNAGILAKIQDATSRSQAAELSREIGERIRSQQGRVAQNKDMTEDGAVDEWYKSTKDLREKYGKDGNQALAVHSQSLIEQGATIMRQTVGTARLQRVKQSAINTVDLAEKSGDEDQLEQGLSVLRHFTPDDQFEGVRKKSYNRMQTHQVENSIGGDPYAVRDDLAKPDFLARHPHLTAGDLPRLQSMAAGAARQSLGKSVTSFNQDLLTDNLKSREDVARVYGRSAPPQVVEQMQQQFDRKHDETEGDLRVTPAYQNQKSGEVGRMLDGLATAKGADFEKNYTAAAFELSLLEDSPGKAYQMERLNASVAGRAFRPKDRKQAAFAALDGFITRDAGNFQPSVRVGTMDPLSGAVSYGPGKPLRDIRAGLAHPEDEDEAISHQMAADSRSGELFDKLSNYFEINPDASAQDIEKQVLALHSEVVRGNRGTGNRFPRPGEPEGPPPGRDLLEVVGRFSAGRTPSGAGQGGGDAAGQLAAQLADARAKVDAALAGSDVGFSEHERDALASFTQDQGKDKLAQLLDHGRRSKGDIATSMLRYRNKDGRRSRDLSVRREAERALFLRGYEGRSGSTASAGDGGTTAG